MSFGLTTASLSRCATIFGVVPNRAAMPASLQTFRAGVDELLVFLANTEREAQLIGLLLDEARQALLVEGEKLLLSQIAEARTDRKRYIYCVAIVALYGLLERFVDSLVAAFVERIAGLVDSYQAMPDAIRKNHVPLSLDLVRAIMEDRYQPQDEVIANLHSCLSGAPSFRVNGPAFVLRGNLRPA
jgi:RiboL-PSP-HEPN